MFGQILQIRKNILSPEMSPLQNCQVNKIKMSQIFRVIEGNKKIPSKKACDFDFRESRDFYSYTDRSLLPIASWAGNILTNETYLVQVKSMLST